MPRATAHSLKWQDVIGKPSRAWPVGHASEIRSFDLVMSTGVSCRSFLWQIEVRQVASLFELFQERGCNFVQLF